MCSSLEMGLHQMGLHVLILISVDQAGEEREQTGRIEEGI